jgi:hypothetical protein
VPSCNPTLELQKPTPRSPGADVHPRSQHASEDRPRDASCCQELDARAAPRARAPAPAHRAPRPGATPPSPVQDPSRATPQPPTASRQWDPHDLVARKPKHPCRPCVKGASMPPLPPPLMRMPLMAAMKTDPSLLSLSSIKSDAEPSPSPCPSSLSPRAFLLLAVEHVPSPAPSLIRWTVHAPRRCLPLRSLTVDVVMDGSRSSALLAIVPRGRRVQTPSNLVVPYPSSHSPFTQG